MHVPSILVMQQLDVFTLLLLAKESTNVSHLLAILHPDNVLSNKFNVMMEINAQLILVMLTPELALILLLTVMITMHVPPTLAIYQVVLAYMFPKFVTIKAFALLIAAILALETVSSLTFLLN